MKKFIKKICLALVLFILGQYLPMTVQGVTSITAASESSSATLLYTFEAEAEADITLKDELPNLLSGFSNVNYKVLKPVKLVVYESEKVREDAYYPVIAG